MKKTILVVAKNNKVEALRVAVGLALLDDIVRVVVLGELDETPAVSEQREVLEFAEVFCEVLLDAVAHPQRLSEEIIRANSVYVI